MKKIGLQTWLMFIFMLTALAGCGKSAADRWQEQYDLGAQYLLEENYEEAVVAFAAAIEIEPKEIQAYTGLVQSYQQTGDLESADSAVQSGLAVLSDSSSSTDAQTAFLLAARDLYMATGDNEKLTQILELLLELDPDNAEYQSFLEREAAVQEFLAAHEDLLQRLAQLCESGDDEGVWDIMLSEEYDEAVMYDFINLDRISYPLDSGNALAMIRCLNGTVRVYYGEMQNGLCSGEGTMYEVTGASYSSEAGLIDGHGYNKFTGHWENDLANGEGSLQMIAIYDDGAVTRDEWTGMYLNGKEDGYRTRVLTRRDGTVRTFHYTVENGEPVIIEVYWDSNIVAYADETEECRLAFQDQGEVVQINSTWTSGSWYMIG